MKSTLFFIVFATVGLLISACKPAAVKLTDLPPSPFSLPAGTPPQSASCSRDADKALELHAAATNEVAKKLLTEIQDMKQTLSVLESNAWQNDPLLLVCDQFIEKTHDWAVTKHRAEMNAQARFFSSPNQAEAGRLRKLESDLGQLMHTILLKQLADNPDFTPLITSGFDNMEMLRQLNTNSVARPEQQYYPYWVNDRLIGYRQSQRPVLTNDFSEIKKQIDTRYSLLLAKVAQIQKEHHIPDDVIAGVNYGNLYRMLDGAAEMYLDCRTPKEVRELREKLRRKVIDLSWADKGTRIAK